MTLMINHLIGFGVGPSGVGNDAFTQVLLQFDGPDGSTTFTDIAAGGTSTFTAAGDAQIDMAQARFGPSSLLLDGTGDFISAPSVPRMALGSGDFTVDFWFNRNGGNGTRRCAVALANPTIIDNSSVAFYVELTTANVMRADFAQGSAGLFSVIGTTVFTALGWHHVAVTRSGSALRLFINGVQEGATATITGAVNNVPSGHFVVGSAGQSAAVGRWNGWIDEVRYSVGIARWTANFTPPTEPYG